MRVATLFAHPDDETALAGGLLARHAAAGDHVTIISATRGEGGETGDPPLCTRAELGTVRAGELACAATALGAREVRFLGFVDPPIEIDAEATGLGVPLAELADAIVAALEQLRPDVLITHGSGGEYGHRDHILLHQAVRAALARPGSHRPATLLTAAANAAETSDWRLTNRADPADLVVDIAIWLPAKIAAYECHRTQVPMIRRNNQGRPLLEIVRSIEAFRRWPADGSDP